MLPAPDTPRLIRSFIFGPETRFDIMRWQESTVDIRAVPEVTFDFYKHSVLPKVEDGALNMACDKLKEEGALTTDGWVSLRFPEDNKESKNDIYAPLATYLQKIVGQHSLIRFSSKPKSEGDHSSYIADIHGMMIQTTAVDTNDKVSYDSAMIGKFKKNNTIGDLNNVSGSIWFISIWM